MNDLQEWLEGFVKFVKKKWKEKEKEKQFVKIGALEGLPDGKTTTDVGRVTEDFIVDKVKEIKVNGRRRYKACKSPQSQTPADVWGIAVYDKYVHLMLIQVKGTYSKDYPEKLSIAKERKLIQLASFTYDWFYEYAKKTGTFTSKSLIITYGYAGVIIEDEDFEIFTLYETQYLSEFFSEDLEYMIGREIERLAHYHELED